MRYLLLTKGEPHEAQIGRFVERINAITTTRLFSLKHWPVIRNAGSHIRVLGRELDGVLANWSKSRVQIEQAFQHDIARLHVDPSNPTKQQTVESAAVQKANDLRLRKLNALIGRTEQRLIELGAALDNVGRGGSARLLYAIDRSRYFIGAFERMAPTLEVGNIDGWITHSQFIDRGIKPAFDLIRNIGDNHVSLRNRLEMITEMIQTSALIVEAGATSSNTEILRKIASNWYWTRIGIWALIAGFVVDWLLNKSGAIALEAAWDFIMRSFAGVR